ncbi:hypothetical protein [Thiomicrorhabdus lithotrophica]|uniref:Uncharacterized protein n=1 Tax=Thiomicrorhabdus lithotrophica TaxID=2949997 RepID=A0ABY8C887_9GAMM|nr:hypothetical protein [Thiomicrorhabdus lithotrophica]WEJ62170.1 hypothetical protein NR989_09130 [Thiomicrorhabdus lithotrophica]
MAKVNLSYGSALDAVKRAEKSANLMGEKFCIVAWGNQYLVKRYNVAQSLGERVLEVCSPMRSECGVVV